MSFTAESGRRQILEDGSVAAAELTRAVEALSEAYESLDEDAAERMEESLFRPVQHALGLLRRTLSAFAARYGLAAPAASPTSGAPSGGGPGRRHDARAIIDSVAEAARSADAGLAELQDSLLPIEVGDEELRAGLSGTRELLDPVPRRCTELLRTLGR